MAGGRSRRMGRDKAFLTLGGKPFVSVISLEMSGLTDDVLVVIGRKRARQFRRVLDRRVRIVRDEYKLDNPMGGMLSACGKARHRYLGVLADDMPLAKSGVILSLYRAAHGHSAAIPRWENGDLEPLCAVYRVREAERAGLGALEEGKIGGRSLISYLPDAIYVPVESLRAVDPGLSSLTNVNSREDMARLVRIKGAGR